jgi:Pvc16 N-terminal domain
MSNHLAIATVTATLQRILQATVQTDLPGAKVTTTQPNTGGNGGTPELGVNIYLYLVSPNPAWRNSDLRTRRPKGDLIKQAQTGLDLYYIITCYGDDIELEPQRLMGSVVRTIVDYPLLTPEMIQETVNNPTFSFLADSDLEQQVERVKILPNAISVEEQSKIWSNFVQSPYTLSFTFQASAVLIEGSKHGSRALPVRSTGFYTAPYQPVISQVIPDTGVNQPILANSSLTIRGQQLQGDRPQVKIGDSKLQPQEVSEKEILLDLSSLPIEHIKSLRAGVQSLQVLHSFTKPSKIDPERFIASNVVPFVLCPIITEVEVKKVEDDGYDLYSAQISVQLDLTVGANQRVFLLLNERISSKETERSLSRPAAYIFPAKSRSQDSNLITFSIDDVKAGDYLARVQIDGAESPLYVDTNPDSETYEQYIHPMVVIG